MTTIFERVSNALGTILPAVPFSLDPYLSSDGNLPDTFLVYLLVDGSPEQHADDAEQERGYLVQVSIYSRSGLAALPDVDGVMTAAGFQIGSEHQLPKDQETGHFGLAKEYVYLDQRSSL